MWRSKRSAGRGQMDVNARDLGPGEAGSSLAMVFQRDTGPRHARVEPGDFYPGEVEPATFAPAPGWYTGTTGLAAVERESE